LRVLSLLFFLVITTIVWTPSARAESFNNPLIDAADLGQKDKVAQLLKSGYKPDTKGDFGVTALMRAAFRGNLEIVHLLLENGAYVNASDIGGETALHLAARNGYPDVVKELLNSDAFIDIPDKENWTPLMRAVTGKQTEVASILIEKGADLTAVNERGESVLVHAAIIGKPEIMKMILGSKSFAKIPEDQKKSAQIQAEKKGNEEVGKMLSATNQYVKKQAEKKNETTELASLDENPSTTKKIPPSDNESSFQKRYSEPAYKPIHPSAAPATQKVSTANGLTPSMDWNSDSFESEPVETTPKIKPSGSSTAKPLTPADKKPVTTKLPKTTENDAYDDGSSYTMQLGSFANEDKALTIWNNLKNNNSDLLAQLDPDVLAVPSAKGKDYYLRAGHYQWKDVAEASCSSLRTRNIDCLALPVSSNQHSLTGKVENKPIEKAELAPKPVDKDAPTDITPKKNPQLDAPSTYAQNTQATENELPWMNTPNYKPRQTWSLPEESLPPVNQQPLSPLEKSTIPPQYEEYQSEAVAEQTSVPQQQFFNDIIDNQPKHLNEGRYQTQLPPKTKSATQSAPKEQMGEDNISAPAPDAKKEQNYNEFYKEIEQKSEKRAVSEAVLVPDDLYFSDSVSTSGPATNWLKIGNFSDKEAANDYADRMFRYDENLSGLDITISGSQPKFTLLVGPLSGSDANNLCATVRSGNMQCSAASSGTKAASSPSATNTMNEKASTERRPLPTEPEPQKAVSDYWINLGTFSDAPEAEYYWTFLLEDNQDILANLKYNMVTPENKGEYGNDAIQLKAGPFGSDSRATQICNIMRFRNVACLVTH
jgi:ankyrin repeat protein